MKNIIKFSIITSTASFIIALTGCELLEDRGNPNDPLSSNYNTVNSTGLSVPGAPGVPSVIGDNTKLELTWSTVSGATAYEVWYNTENNSAAAIQKGGDITVTSYSITGLSNGVTYFIWLKAKNSAGTSAFSSTPATGVPTTVRWKYTNSFTGSRTALAGTVHNNYLYINGGFNSSVSYNDVQYAYINADGTIGTWAVTTPFTNARNGHNNLVYNGYMYIIGGSTYNDVQYAYINANGTIGSWTFTTSFGNARNIPASAAYNGYLYVTGGANEYTRYNDVIYAPINADGTIGTWTATTSFTNGRCAHTCVAYNGYLYIIGGEGSLNDVQYAPINADGSIGSWSTTTSLTPGRGGHTCVINGGYIYIIGGYSGGTCRSDVIYALINGDGTIGTWNTTASFTTGRAHHASVVKNGYLYVIGGYNNGSSFYNDVQYADISGL